MINIGSSDEELAQCLNLLRERLRTSYDGIGHSSGRPYIYFVYMPEKERTVRRLASEQLRSDNQLFIAPIDILPLIIASLHGQEERRQQLLENPVRAASTAEAILRLWTHEISAAIEAKVTAAGANARPVVVLSGLAALHPLGNPTSLMEFLAEHEPRHPMTSRVVPIVLLIPGFRPPQTGRAYHFLSRDHPQLSFYRGEEI